MAQKSDVFYGRPLVYLNSWNPFGRRFFLFHCVFMRCFFDIHIFNDRNENVLWLPLKTQMNGNREIGMLSLIH